MVGANDWKRVPFERGGSIPFQATYSREQLEKIRAGLVPEEMEDKWFVYFEDPFVFFHHSWTGDPVYRITLVQNTHGAVVTEALCATEVLKRSSPEYEAELLDFVISNLLLGQSRPFPLPAGYREQPPGLLQHAVAGTAFPEMSSTAEPKQKRWWRFWR